MNFYVPYSDGRQSEEVWHEVREALHEIGLPTTERRIQALSLANGRTEHILAVGMPVPDCDEPVLLILEASGIDIFYVCTESNGVDEGVHIPMGLTPHGRAIDFDPPGPQRLN